MHTLPNVSFFENRLVGFELSEILWKKVKGKLSAGRVQSVAVKIIVEREREIMKFEATPFFRVSAFFDVKNEAGRIVKLKAELPSRFDNLGDAESFLKNCNGATFSINNIAVKPLKRKPTAPFTTSTLQQEASRKLGFSVNRTMQNAQRLYEQGHITYMRTDSVNLSETAIKAVALEIEQKYGKEYVQTRRFKTKKENAQEAHEAIRPTNVGVMQATSDRDQQRLYELIWKRTIASQMAEAILEKTIVEIGVSTIPNRFLKAEGEVLKFDGFLKVYLASKDDDEEDDTAKGILPPLSVGQNLVLDEMTAIERFTRPPARYTEASLVKKLEELGIGRPSTYAPTISKIMEANRGYVSKEEREGVERKYQILKLKDQEIKATIDTEMTGAVKNRLIPSDLGMLVSDFLSKHFSDIMTYNFTADIEKNFDHIASGGQQWNDMIGEFYKPFHATVEETLEHADRATGERILGKDPESGRTLLVRMSRFGPLVQIGTMEELGEEKPRYANLRPGQSLETIVFDDALELFKLPKDLGEYQGHDVIIGIGRYGPYVKYDGAFISLGRGTDPLEVTKEEAIVLIEEKKKADAPVATYQGLPVTKGELIAAKIEKEANRYIHKWDDLKLAVENGRWGPFVRWGKKSIKIPKIDGERMTSEQAKEMMTLEEAKKLVEAEFPDAFKKKERKKKASAKKKKAPAKKK